jgi:hypothetical protein
MHWNVLLVLRHEIRRIAHRDYEAWPLTNMAGIQCTLMYGLVGSMLSGMATACMHCLLSESKIVMSVVAVTPICWELVLLWAKAINQT